jgi:hypothetical protein
MTREATKKEIKAYEKVESILTMEEMEVIFDALDDEQTFDDLLNNKVTDEQIQAIIQEHKISVKELSDWYFTEIF